MENVGMLIHTFLVAAAVVAAPSINIESSGHPPKGWAVISQPKSEAEWSCANYSQQEWAVSGTSAKNAGISPYRHASEVRLSLPDGQLIGTNHGEFGGKIEWIGLDAVRRVVIPDKNPIAFTIRGDDVFVATGLAHLSQDSGEIIRLRRVRGGAWQASTVISVGEAPNAAVRVDSATWMLLTTNGVTKIDLSKLTKESIYRNNHWWMLYANSIRPLGTSWLVGARRAVIRVTPANGSYTEEWLVPANCKTLTKPNCGCKP